MTPLERLERHRPQLEASLRLALAEGPADLLRLSRYVMGWEDESGRPSEGGGKRLRPLLCLEVALLSGGELEGAMPGAIALELVHNFSLVHDDIQDRDVTRHGRPTAWTVIGEAQAINLGNFLYTRGLQQLQPATTAGRQLATAMLFDAVERMVAGQWADIAFERADTVSEDDYLQMVEGKTGALLGAAAGIGAALGGAPPEVVEGLRRWGVAIGLAFQVRDDYLGTWGNPGATGKSASSDLARRKKTLPVVYALGTSAGLPLLRILRRPETTDADITEALRLLESCGAREHTEAVAQRLAAEAGGLLAALPIPAEARAALGAIGSFLAQRDR